MLNPKVHERKRDGDYITEKEAAIEALIASFEEKPHQSAAAAASTDAQTTFICPNNDALDIWREAILEGLESLRLVQNTCFDLSQCKLSEEDFSQITEALKSPATPENLNFIFKSVNGRLIPLNSNEFKTSATQTGSHQTHHFLEGKRHAMFHQIDAHNQLTPLLRHSAFKPLHERPATADSALSATADSGRSSAPGRPATANPGTASAACQTM